MRRGDLFSFLVFRFRWLFSVSVFGFRSARCCRMCFFARGMRSRKRKNPRSTCFPFPSLPSLPSFPAPPKKEKKRKTLTSTPPRRPGLPPQTAKLHDPPPRQTNRVIGLGRRAARSAHPAARDGGARGETGVWELRARV